MLPELPVGDVRTEVLLDALRMFRREIRPGVATSEWLVHFRRFLSDEWSRSLEERHMVVASVLRSGDPVAAAYVEVRQLGY